jgi:hypothetical protein
LNKFKLLLRIMITRKLSGRVRGLRLVKNRLKLTLRVSTIDLIWTKSLPRLRKPTRIKILRQLFLFLPNLLSCSSFFVTSEKRDIVYLFSL